MQRFMLAIIALFICFGAARAQAPSSGTVNSTANIRNGPSTSNTIVGSLTAGTEVEITGCNTDCSWYEIGPDRWIAAFLVTVDTAAPQPTATSTPTVPPTSAAPITTTAASTATITIIGWNVESGGALQSAVADRMGSFDGVDIWALSEVNAIDAEAFEFGAEEGEGANYESFLGTTGAADRLLIIWDEERFNLMASGQLTEIGLGARAPVWVALRETATNLDFVVVVNHLHRSNEGTRHRQAEMLNAWGAAQTMPVIALGDYNFDWNLPNGELDHDLGYDNMVKDGVWEWIRPVELVTTQCSGWPCGFNSVLDFVFVTGPARDWNISSEIIVVESDFPDDLTTPDHRPVMAVIMPPGVVALPAVTPTPTSAASIAPTATTALTCAQANTNANLRAGPGTGFAVVGSVPQGQCLTITGRTTVGDWFQLDNGNWIAAFLVVNPPAMAGIPVVTVAAPTPLPATPTTAPAATQAPQQEQPTSIPPTATPVPPTATPQPPAQPCDPSYPGVCIAPYPPDLDCGQIPFRRFQVVGADPHGFDGDNDGIGCES